MKGNVLGYVNIEYLHTIDPLGSSKMIIVHSALHKMHLIPYKLQLM